MAVVGILLLFSGVSVASEPVQERMPTEEQYTRILERMVETYRNPAERARYYTREKLSEISHAVFELLRSRDMLNPGHLALLTASLDQQSRFQGDAVAEWNRDEKGERIIVPKEVAWTGNIRKEPKIKALDFGIYQFHYGTAMSIGRKEHGPDFELTDLQDLSVILPMAATHIVQQEQACRPYKESRDLRFCKPYLTRKQWCSKKKGCSLTCRCAVVRQATGVEYGTLNGNPSSLRQFTDKYWAAAEAVLKEDERDTARYLFDDGMTLTGAGD
jgi:hypothetical protein